MLSISKLKVYIYIYIYFNIVISLFFCDIHSFYVILIAICYSKDFYNNDLIEYNLLSFSIMTTTCMNSI